MAWRWYCDNENDIPQDLEYVKFNDIVPDVDKLSAGCKTVLNVLYNPDKVFCLKECGNNALVPLKMTAVNIQTSSGKEEIYDDEQRDEQNALILK